MIKGMHATFFTSEPVEMREFLRDKLGFPATDVGGGWLIMDAPAADMGCHPVENGHGQPAGAHEVSFWCADIHETVTELKQKGVEFKGDVRDEGFGMVTSILAPGGVEIMLYEPRYSK